MIGKRININRIPQDKLCLSQRNRHTNMTSPVLTRLFNWMNNRSCECRYGIKRCTTWAQIKKCKTKLQSKKTTNRDRLAQNVFTWVCVPACGSVTGSQTNKACIYWSVIGWHVIHQSLTLVSGLSVWRPSTVSVFLIQQSYLIASLKNVGSHSVCLLVLPR